MHILHIGDTHLGKRQYRSDVRYEDFFDTFQEIVQYAIDQNVDAVIQTGDLFDTPDPSLKTIHRCINVLSELEDIPFYAIVGNHERKRDGQWLDILDQLDSAERLSRDATVVSTDSESVALYGIDAVRKPQWDSTDFSLKAAQQPVDHSIVCMHELLSPPIQVDASSNRSLETYDTEEVLNRLQGSELLGNNQQVDVLSLGDYHHPIESTVNGVLAYYAGATERTKRNQAQTVAAELHITEDEISKEKVQLQQSRPFVTAELTLESGMTYGDVQDELSETDFSQVGRKNSVAVIELSGDEIGVSIQDVEEIATTFGATVVRVVDNRSTSGMELEDMGELEQTESYEEQISSAIADETFSSETLDVEELIRDQETPDSNVREKVSAIITEDSNTGDQE